MAKLAPPLSEFLLTVLGEGEQVAPSLGERELATVLFTDIVASTERAAEVGDSTWRTILDRHEGSAAELVDRAGGRFVKTTGDGLVATFRGPSHAVTAARSIQDAALSLGVGVRAGLHTGEIERRGNDIGGISVHIAARISALARAGEILVSRTVRDLTVGSRLQFDDRGTHALKGVPEQWQLFAVR
jgi:class 3 adenylate cyclase